MDLATRFIRPPLARVLVAAILALSWALPACRDFPWALDPEVVPTPRPLTESEQIVADELVAFAPSSAGEPLPATALATYGNRAGFFNWTPAAFRPEADWRSALDGRLADAEPQWSQGFEELIIRDYFRDRRDGFFLDVGCSKPRSNSTTYYLERNLGWSGIAIDAMAKHAQPWKEQRPNSTFLAYAVTDKDRETVTFHVGNVANALDEEIVRGFGGKKSEIQVTTMTLNTILEDHGVEKVDFLSMDIEGAEPAALRGFDIERYKPDLCCIEGGIRDEVVAYFVGHGYELIEKYRKADKINFYFRPTSGK